MDRRYCRRTVQESDDSPPSEVWLFAQAILGKPIPSATSAAAHARAKREFDEFVASISPEYKRRLQDEEAARAAAAADRELLQWAAQISPRAEEKLRAIQSIEQQQRSAWQAAKQFIEANSLLAEWNEADHPRAPKGTPIGGQWVDKDGGGGGASIGADRVASSQERQAGEEKKHNPRMLELAHAWWQTKGALEQARRDIEELPGRIASERAQLRFGGRPAPVHAHRAANAQRELDAAKALAPELEKQLRELEQQYHDLGYADVPYSTWTPGETFIAGRGIEEVGRAVAMSGRPAGLTTSSIDVDIATLLLGGPAALRLGRAILGRSIRKAPIRILRRASLGHATSTNYRKTFLAAHPHLDGKVIVHHGVEQQVLTKYPGVVTESELHSLQNLRGIPKNTNSETHLRAIRKEWNAFYDQHPHATKEQLLDKATEIDGKYGHLFDPPIR